MKQNLVKVDKARMKEFNLKAALVMKNEKKLTKAMLKINEEYAYINKGNYPETDNEWIDCLCTELLDVLISWFNESGALVDEGFRELWSHMVICKLTSISVDELNQ